RPRARRPRARRRSPARAGAAPGRGASSLGKLERLAQSVWGQILFRQFALARQHQLEGIQQVRLGFGQGFTLRNGGGNLLHETSVSALFGRLKDRCQFHAPRLPHRAALGKWSRGAFSCGTRITEHRPLVHWPLATLQNSPFPRFAPLARRNRWAKAAVRFLKATPMKTTRRQNLLAAALVSALAL